MSLPQSILIGPIEYCLKEVSGLRSTQDHTEILGEMDPTECFIRVEADIPSQRKQVTLWHEIIHAILAQAQRRDVSDEVVGVVSFGIVEVLRRNPALAALNSAGRGSDDRR